MSENEDSSSGFYADKGKVKIQQGTEEKPIKKQSKSKKKEKPQSKSKPKSKEKAQKKTKNSSTMTKNKKKLEDNERMKEGLIRGEELLEGMKRSYEQDRISYKNGDLAHKKIVYCKEIESQIRNIYVCEGFLEIGGLEEFQKWLTKPQYGAEPSLTLKVRMLRILSEMSIHPNYLAACKDLETIVQKNKRSLMKEIRELSEAIITKWERCAFDDIN